MRIYNKPYDQCLIERPYFFHYSGDEYKESSGRKGRDVICCKTRDCKNCRQYFYPIQDKEIISDIGQVSKTILPVRQNESEIKQLANNISELGKKYYFVHNYFKVKEVIPYVKLQPRGDSGFKALDSFLKNYKYFDYTVDETNYADGLKNYKNYISGLKYEDDLVPAQSNIGIFFWLIPKEKINEKNFISEEIKNPINGFAYIFDVDKLINYIFTTSSFDNKNAIPKIYWSPNNYYGIIQPFESILGYNQIDFVKDVNHKMKGAVLKTHEVISLVAIDTSDPSSGFLGILNSTVRP